MDEGPGVTARQEGLREFRDCSGCAECFLLQTPLPHVTGVATRIHLPKHLPTQVIMAIPHASDHQNACWPRWVRPHSRKVVNTKFRGIIQNQRHARI